MIDFGLHTWKQRASERGTILIAVGLAILLLSAFCVFVLDYGVMWLSRRQAQNAADSGALAGAVARAFDEVANPPSAGGSAELAATKAALANQVFGGAPGVSVSWACPGFVDANGRCVRVDVFRDGTNGSSVLPVYFAPLLGIASQGTRATATARSQPANASDCLRPLSVPDKWTENLIPSSTFNRYYESGPNKGAVIPPNPDVYVPPSASGPGTGYTIAADYGQQMILKSGGSSISQGWHLPVRLPRVGSDSGGDVFRENLASCAGVTVSIGDYLEIESGNKVGPTAQGIADLIAQDPSAYWDAANQRVASSCAPGCGPFSPRIVALPVFNTDIYQYNVTNTTWPNCPGGVKCLKVVNILGYFIDRMAGNDVIGYLVRYPGKLSASTNAINEASAFAQVITLIR